MADAGYSSEANAQYAVENGIDAYVGDTLFRKRDPRFVSAELSLNFRPFGLRTALLQLSQGGVAFPRPLGRLK